MFLFPSEKSDPDRRALWTVKVKRADFTPNKWARLCEDHFDSSQFMPRVDGKKQLKWNAVPTIFTYRSIPKERKTPKRLLTSQSTPQVANDHAYSLVNLVERSVESSVPEIALGFSLLDEHQEVGQDVDMTFLSDDDQGQVANENVPFNHQRILGQNVSTLKSSSPKNVLGPGTFLQIGGGAISHEEDVLTCRQTCHSNVLRLEETITQLKNERERDRADILSLKQKLRQVTLEKNKQEIARKKEKAKHKRGQMWDNKRIQEALQLKFACGTLGYTLLRQQGYDLPSITTLYERTSQFCFKPGMLEEVFEMLARKTKVMRVGERKCVLTLDEMNLEVGWNYDPKSGSYYGNVTLPEHSGPATHALTFMLGGLSTHWKQAVCYHFTPDSVDGSVFKKIIHDIILKAESINLDVVSVVSDMGGSNQKMWR